MLLARKSPEYRAANAAAMDAGAGNDSSAEAGVFLFEGPDAQSNCRCPGGACMTRGLMMKFVVIAVGALACKFGASSWTQQGDLTSLVGAEATKIENMGCLNWRSITLEPIGELGEDGIHSYTGGHESIELNVDACAVRCSQNPGCVGFNFQKTMSCDSHVSTGEPSRLAQGACFLWAENTCEQEANDCWDLYWMLEPVPRAWTLESAETGCGNWEAIEVGRTLAPNPHACGRASLLHKASGPCKYFNFRANPKNPKDFGTCIFFGGVCDVHKNSEFDLYRLLSVPEPTPTPVWTLVDANKGCRNWNEARLGSASIELNPAGCGDRCGKTPGCKFFNWQKGRGGHRPDDPTVDGHELGACYVYGAACDQETNYLWDLYRYGLSEPLVPTPAPEPLGDWCPSAGDFHIHGVTGVKQPVLRNRGYTIYGGGHVSTSATFNLMDGGWVSYTLDLSKVKTSKENGKYVSARTFLLMPDGRGPYDGETQACSAQGRVAQDFCPELEMVRTNGQSAYMTSWRIVSTQDAENPAEKCATAQDIDRSRCRAERFFKNANPSCASAADPKVDVTEKIHVKWEFTGISATLTLAQKGQDVESIPYELLNSGTEEPTASTLDVLAFMFEKNGAAISGALGEYPWVPGLEDPQTGNGGAKCLWSSESLDASEMTVSDLTIHGLVVRGGINITPCPQ